MSSPIPVRFPTELEARVARRARAAGSPKSKVVVTAVREWLLMQEHPQITFASTNTSERRARLMNGPEVWTVAAAWVQQPKRERNSADLADVLGLEAAQIEAGLDYWADQRGEIDRLIELHHEAQQIELEAWERRRALETI